MSEDNLESKGRRAFLRTSAQVAVTAPAVSMLLAASAKPAGAGANIYGGGARIDGLEESGADGIDGLP